MGINVWEVIDASSTKPFGFMPFYPGPGLGGHCIPIDPYYLTWKAKEYNFITKFIHLSGEINTSMPNYVVSKLNDALNSKRKSLNGAKILILGVAYKKDVDDIRESPALAIMKILQEKGAYFYYNDPYVPKIGKTRDYHFDLHSIDLTKELLNIVDVVLIITNHSSYDYNWIVQNSKLIVDTRNATRDILDGREKIILA
jgi:UDP-N-acetyl-D-glucosamine dehydrogenase